MPVLLFSGSMMSALRKYFVRAPAHTTVPSYARRVSLPNFAHRRLVELVADLAESRELRSSSFDVGCSVAPARIPSRSSRRLVRESSPSRRSATRAPTS